jgi:hypothetical protein
VKLKFELIRWMKKTGLCRYREAIGFMVSPASNDINAKSFCRALFSKCLNGEFPFKVEGTQIVFCHPDFDRVGVECVPPDTEKMIANIKYYRSWLGYMDHPKNNPENGFKYEVMTCF